MATDSDHIVVVRAVTISANVVPPERKEISDLIKNDPIGFSLYARALALMKKTNQDLDASYYQISGIHGQPYVAWQGAGGGKAGSPNKGYCCHSSVLFPTWHRPYLALYEQILIKHAKEAAAGMPVKWRKKAEELRLPYWDWATTLQPPCQIMEGADLKILAPDGSTETVKNPFLNYTFNPVPDFSLNHSSATFRCPEFTEEIAKEIKLDTYYLLIRAIGWEDMSNDCASYGPGHWPRLATSLEQIHNNIHNKTGGFMGEVRVAAFDPIFWMHHANVDRLLAIWQGIHRGRWVIPSEVTSESETWNLSVGTKMDATTPLEPFWDGKTETSYWNSNDSIIVDYFGYTYPELKDRPSRYQLVRRVTRLYGQGAISHFTKVAATFPAHSSQAKILQTTAARLPSAKMGDILPHARLPKDDLDATARGVLGALAPAFLSVYETSPEATESDPADEGIDADAQTTGLLDWAARVHVEKYALGTSFDVVIFLLPPGGDKSAISTTESSSWFRSPYYVGSVSAFVNSQPEHCANCQNAIAQSLRIEGFVDLNEAIVNRSGLDSFEEEVVHAYLQQNIAWRIRKVGDGSTVPIEQISSLEVTVWSSALRSSSVPRALPVFERPQHHHSITAGLVGGSRAAIA